ncbi:MAG: hypothetical protein BWX80_04142 [Candidatus Hydrogenedentes bacterium ADurb.Bin101]|nr:MAG: hypothetical protein BWX80_04142 [Candidatus Hydrogenedentes bacterium ADurb.Bin101]
MRRTVACSSSGDWGSALPVNGSSAASSAGVTGMIRTAATVRPANKSSISDMTAATVRLYATSS